LCSVQTFSNGTGQPPFEVFRGCSDKQIDCGIFEVKKFWILVRGILP